MSLQFQQYPCQAFSQTYDTKCKKHKLNETIQILNHHVHMEMFKNQNYTYPLLNASWCYLNSNQIKKQR